MTNVTFQFVEAQDESEDSEYQVLLCGQPTRFSIQCCLHGEYAVVEHGFKDGQLDWIKHLAVTRSLEAAKIRARKELAKIPDLEMWPFVPHHPEQRYREAFARIFDEAKCRWPGVTLGYVGHDGQSIYMQKTGNPTPYRFPISVICEGWQA